MIAVSLAATGPAAAQPVDIRARIAICYSMGATTPTSMAVCSGRQVSGAQFESCMRGGPCFDAPVGPAGMTAPGALVPAVQDRSCGTAGRPACPLPMPCGYRDTIDCPVFAMNPFGPVQVSGAHGCGALGYPPCREPRPCGYVGTLPCAPPPPLYLPPSGQAFAVPPPMKQASLVDFQPDVQVIMPSDSAFYPSDIPKPGVFGAEQPAGGPATGAGTGAPPDWAAVSFNFESDTPPPRAVPQAFQVASTHEFVPPILPDLDRLAACRAAASTQADFARCVVERAMPPGFRIRKECAEAFSDLPRALLCSSDDPRLLEAYTRVEATARCTREHGASGVQLERCLAKAWAGKHEQALNECAVTSKTFDAYRTCLGAIYLTHNDSPYVRCAARKGTAEEIATCIAQEVTRERLPVYVACVEQSSGNPVRTASCLAGSFAGAKEKAMLGCIAESPADVPGLTRCISNGTMGEKERAYLECAVASQGDKKQWALCFGRHALGKNERAYLECALQRDPSTSIASCVGRAYLGSSRQHAMLQCALNAGDSVTGLATCLGDGALGERERAILSCARQADAQGFAACVGKQFLGPDQQQFVQCAVDNQFNLGTTAVCAMGPRLGLNPEAQIALTCAATSGGEPTVFASCAGGQLAQRELDKCWQGGVGTQDGCYGPNNSLRKFFDNVDGQLRTMLGENNALYGAYNAYHKNVLSPGKNHEFVKLLNSGLNDLRNGAGPNHEVRKVGKAVEKGFHKVSKATRIKIKW
jgi:hypothetical protein